MPIQAGGRWAAHSEPCSGIQGLQRCSLNEVQVPCVLGLQLTAAAQGPCSQTGVRPAGRRADCGRRQDRGRQHGQHDEFRRRGRAGVTSATGRSGQGPDTHDCRARWLRHAGVARSPSWPRYRECHPDRTAAKHASADLRAPLPALSLHVLMAVSRGHSCGPLIFAVDQPAAASGEERLLKPLPDWGSSELRELGAAITRDIYQQSPGKSRLPHSFEHLASQTPPLTDSCYQAVLLDRSLVVRLTVPEVTGSRDMAAGRWCGEMCSGCCDMTEVLGLPAMSAAGQLLGAAPTRRRPSVACT